MLFAAVVCTFRLGETALRRLLIEVTQMSRRKHATSVFAGDGKTDIHISISVS